MIVAKRGPAGLSLSGFLLAIELLVLFKAKGTLDFAMRSLSLLNV